jgi:hypothetical protein
MVIMYTTCFNMRKSVTVSLLFSEANETYKITNVLSAF